MDFTIVDGGVGAITLISAVLAYSRGFTREVLAIGGWLIAAAAAAFLTPMAEPLMREIPAVGPFLASSCVLSVIAAFTVIMAVALLIMAVFTPIFSNLILDSVLGPLDRVLGFAFGIGRGVLFAVIAYILYVELIGDPADWDELANSQTALYIGEISTTIRTNLPTELPSWLTERIDAMMAPCTGATGGEPVEPLPVES
ncbi:MAG: CvpA family protein [Paracoccaceae bacterium]